MKAIQKIVIILLVFFGGVSNMHAQQKFDARLVLVSDAASNSGDFDVRVDIRNNPSNSNSSFDLETANIRFNFDETVIDVPTLQTAHNFNSFSSSSGPNGFTVYDNMTVNEPVGGVAGINISFSTGDRTTVDTNWTQVATLRFTIQDASKDEVLTLRDASAVPRSEMSRDSSGTPVSMNVGDYTNYASYDIVYTGTGWIGGNGANGKPNATDNLKDAIVLGKTTLTNSASVNDLIIDDGCSLTIGPGSYIDVQGAGTVQGAGKLILDADASGYAQLSGAITGNVTVRQHISGTTEWRNIGLPVDAIADSLTFNGINFTYGGGTTGNLYVFNAATSKWDSVASGTHAFDGRGYSAYMGPPHFSTFPITLEVTGTVGNGTKNLNLDFFNTNTASFDGWNLISNPYPSNLDWDVLNDNLSANTNATVAVWNPSAGQYADYNEIAGANNGGQQYIAPFQAFWIKATVDDQALPLTNSDRTFTTGSFFKKPAKPEVLRLEVEGTNGWSDQTSVYFHTLASAGYDREYDSEKLKSPMSEVPTLFSYDNNYNEYSINGLPEFAKETRVEIGFTSEQNIGYSIKKVDADAIDNAIDVFVEDHVTGAFHNIKVADYNFTHSTNYVENRFTLHIIKNTIGVEEEVNEPLRIVAFDNHVNIDFGSLQGRADIEVFNLSGQLVYDKSDVKTDSDFSFRLRTKIPTLYTVRVLVGSNEYTKKVIL